MSRYGVELATVAPAAGAPYATIAAGTKRVELRELGLFCNAATASSVRLLRPANTPVATTSTLCQPHDPANTLASTTNIGTAWSTVPTISTNIGTRRITLPAQIGAGVIWTFYDSPLVIPPSGWLVLWNFGAAAGSVLNMYATVDE